MDAWRPKQRLCRPWLQRNRLPQWEKWQSSHFYQKALRSGRPAKTRQCFTAPDPFLPHSVDRNRRHSLIAFGSERERERKKNQKGKERETEDICIYIYICCFRIHRERETERVCVCVMGPRKRRRNHRLPTAQREQR